MRAVTDRIRARSAATRAAYVQRIDAAARQAGEIARAVRAERERVIPDLPAGTKLEINLDRSMYIEASMIEVVDIDGVRGR